MIVAETERLIVRWFEERDAAFMLQLLNEPSWLEQIGDRGVRTLDEAVAYLQNGPIAMYAAIGFSTNLVELKETGEAIGTCGLIKRDSLDDVDLGYAFSAARWGQGFALEASRAVMLQAKNDLGLQRVIAITTPTNAASIRLLEKLGMKFIKMVHPDPNDAELKLFAIDF